MRGRRTGRPRGYSAAPKAKSTATTSTQRRSVRKSRGSAYRELMQKTLEKTTRETLMQAESSQAVCSYSPAEGDHSVPQDSTVPSLDDQYVLSGQLMHDLMSFSATQDVEAQLLKPNCRYPLVMDLTDTFAPEPVNPSMNARPSESFQVEELSNITTCSRFIRV